MKLLDNTSLIGPANGIKNYTVGKKDVSCELFLDFIVFDEQRAKHRPSGWQGADPTAGKRLLPRASERGLAFSSGCGVATLVLSSRHLCTAVRFG